MTTQRSFFEERNMSGKFFGFEFGRSWPKILLYTLLIMFFLPIPLLMFRSNESLGVSVSDMEAKTLLNYSLGLLNYVKGSSFTWSVSAAIIAVAAGCISTRFLNSSKSAGFYHSLPLKRESIFAVRFLVGFADFLTALFINTVAVFIICEAWELAPSYGLSVTKEIIFNIGYAVLSFATVCTLIIFSGMLCGTTSMQIITFIYINLFVFAGIFAAVKTLDIFTENIYAGFYLSDEIAINTLPIIKLLVLGNYIGSIDVWTFIIADVVIVMVSLALYKHRKTENAGTPIAFRGFEKIFRYSMIFLVTMLVGIFFETLMGSIAWLVFGLVIGSVLSFMLLNAVLLKNIRKMFNGIKPFAVCLVIITLVYVCLGFDVFGIDEYIPDEKNIKSVTVYEMNDLDKIEFFDKNVIRETVKLDRENHLPESVDAENTESSHTYADGKYTPNVETIFDRNTNYICIAVVYRTKNNIKITRRFHFKNDEKSDDFFESIAKSADFEEAMNNILDSKLNSSVYDYNLKRRILVGEDDEVKYDYGSRYGTAENILKYLKDDYKNIGIYDYLQAANIMMFDFYGKSQMSVPVTTKTGNAKFFLEEGNIDDYFEKLVNATEFIAVAKNGGSEFSAGDKSALKITDKEEIRTVFKNIASVGSNCSYFTRKNHDYNVGVKLRAENGAVGMFSCSFLYDSVPLFVSEHFG